MCIQQPASPASTGGGHRCCAFQIWIRCIFSAASCVVSLRGGYTSSVVYLTQLFLSKPPPLGLLDANPFLFLSKKGIITPIWLHIFRNPPLLANRNSDLVTHLLRKYFSRCLLTRFPEKEPRYVCDYTFSVGKAARFSLHIFRVYIAAITSSEWYSLFAISLHVFCKIEGCQTGYTTSSYRLFGNAFLLLLYLFFANSLHPGGYTSFAQPVLA